MNPLARSRLKSTLEMAKNMSQAYINPKADGSQEYADIMNGLYRSYWDTIIAALDALLNSTVTLEMREAAITEEFKTVPQKNLSYQEIHKANALDAPSRNRGIRDETLL